MGKFLDRINKIFNRMHSGHLRQLIDRVNEEQGGRNRTHPTPVPIGMNSLHEAAIELAIGFDFPWFLVKGGHLKTGQAVDVLASAEGHLHRFQSKRIPGIDPHGTGCTYSAAIVAGLAKGLTIAESVLLGKTFINRALQRRFEIGPYQLLNHLP